AAGVKPQSSLSRSQRYTIQEDYFAQIDSHKKAYWLGWLMSDGNVHTANKGGKIIRISIQRRDEHILDEFRKDIKSNAPISRRATTLGGKQHPQSILTVCCTRMA